jgi:hypothetical protein
MGKSEDHLCQATHPTCCIHVNNAPKNLLSPSICSITGTSTMVNIHIAAKSVGRRIITQKLSTNTNATAVLDSLSSEAT